VARLRAAGEGIGWDEAMDTLPDEAAKRLVNVLTQHCLDKYAIASVAVEGLVPCHGQFLPLLHLDDVVTSGFTNVAIPP
jgi:hypothetical protein